MSPTLDAIVLARDPLAHVRIAGLSVAERGRRIATKLGASRVLVWSGSEDLAAWRGASTAALLVIRADQLVHTPLAAPLVEQMPRSGVAIAVVPDEPRVQDLTPGSYAGALLAAPDAAADVVAALARGTSDRELVAALPDARTIPHGDIARAPIATPAERRAATKLLYKILIKPQDNALTNYVYRPFSLPLTKMFVWTPITPNQITIMVAVVVAIGCWITAQASHTSALVGTALVLSAQYLDCCDGEVARVKLLSSKLGAWLDTVVDELSSVAYMAAVGWHCHLAYGPRYLGDLPFDPWVVAIVISVVTYLWSIFCIYYALIVAIGSANSQDYVGRFEIAPGASENSVRLKPKASAAIVTSRELPLPLKLAATYAPYIVRRDFIAWVAVLLAALRITHVAFALFVAGGLITATIVTIDHIKLRTLRRSVARRGLVLEAP